MMDQESPQYLVSVVFSVENQAGDVPVPEQPNHLAAWAASRHVINSCHKVSDFEHSIDLPASNADDALVKALSFLCYHTVPDERRVPPACERRRSVYHGFSVNLSCESKHLSLSAAEFNLRWAAANNRIALVTGSGVTKNMVPHATCADWPGLLRKLYSSVWTGDEWARTHALKA